MSFTEKVYTFGQNKNTLILHLKLLKGPATFSLQWNYKVEMVSQWVEGLRLISEPHTSMTAYLPHVGHVFWMQCSFLYLGPGIKKCFSFSTMHFQSEETFWGDTEILVYTSGSQVTETYNRFGSRILITRVPYYGPIQNTYMHSIKH